MEQKNSRMNAFRKLIVFLLFAFLSLEASAVIVPYTRGLLKTPDDFSSHVTANDPSGAFTSEIVPVWTGLSYADRSKKGIVTLGVNHHFQYWGEFTTEVKIKLTTYATLAATGVVDTITLKISCFPGDSLSYLDKQSYTFDNVEKFDVMLISVKQNGVSTLDLIENLFIQGDVYVDRVYDFTGQLSTEVNITSSHDDDPLDLDCDMVPDEFVIAWDPVEGAEEYQLEWVYINDYDTTISGLNVDFRLNSTRISTSQTNYHLSLVFDKGYICYRVRAVGRSMTDVSRFIFTPWSTADGLVGVSSCDYYQQTAPYDVLKNWQYSSTYAEEGKKKEVVSFFDGSLRNRQMVTKINTDKNTIVGETIYDHQGRPAIQVLPVPVAPTLCETPDSTNSLKFYEKFNRKNATEAYTKLDFDTSATADSCGAILQGMHVSSGASNYYSGSNPVTDGIQGYVPDAENYPFSQVEYTPDNTGRISRQGGVGPDFQLGSGHETKYFYGHPLQEELDRLFGSEVGYYSHYQKNMVIDPNGQVSVSYLDQEGRVIATSLAGGSPDNLIALESAAEATPMTADLLSPDANGESSSNVLGVDGKSKVFNQTILLSSKTTLEIHYDLNVTPFIDTCMSLDSSVCFNCVYDLQIEVRDNCGRLVSPIAVSDRLTGHFELDTAEQVIFKTDCSALDFDTTFVIDSLEVGSYQISKILTVNEEAIEAYVAMYVNDSLNRCKPGYDEILTEQQSLIDNACDEDFSCQECIENLGTLIEFITAGGTEDEYNLEVAACNGPCTPISYYETMRELLKGDMMPNGQYAQYTNVSGGVQTGMYPVSVLNVDNLLPKEPTSDWKAPRYDVETTILNHYYDPDGVTISRIYLDNVVIASNHVTSSTPAVASATNTVNTHVFLDATTNSYYTYPEYLGNVSDFIGYYGANPYWANSLVYYHPEYPILKYYRQNTLPVTPGDRFTSEGFDAAMMQVNTWDDAVAAGFIKNPWLSEAIDNRLEDFMTDSTHVVWDPAAYYDPSNHIENKVANYITINGTSYSMMEFAAIISRCGNLGLGSYPTLPCTLWGNDVGIDSVQNELTRDQEWMAFRSLYFSVKQKMYQDYIEVATITDPGYYGYNACIGDANFNRFAHGFFTFGFVGPFPYPSGQYNNNDQPCSAGRWPFYQNKQIRFGTPKNLSDLSPQQVAYQTYLITSQCPNASTLQSVLSEVANSGQLDDVTFSLNGLNSFSGLLLALNDFDLSTPNQNMEWLQTTINSSILEVVWNETGIGPFSTLSLLKDPLDSLGYSWSQVIGFSNLYYTEYDAGNSEFTVTATVQIGSAIYHVPVTGKTTIPLGNCQFESLCEKNDAGRDLEQLFKSLSLLGDIDNTTPFNLSTSTAYPSLLTSVINHAVSLNSPGNLSWVFDPGIPAFKITNAANSDYLRLGILAFTPSSFTASNMSLIASIDKLVVGSGNTYELVCKDVSGNYLVTIKCDAVRVTPSGMQSIELGDCGLPTPLLCSSEPHKNTEDLEDLFSDILVNQDAPFDLYNSVEMSSSLEGQINAPTSHAYGTVTTTDTTKVLTFNVPTDCEITLTHDSIPGLTFSFDSIVSVEGMELTGEFNSFSAYNYFDLTVKASINDTLRTIILKGFTCLNLKECESCVEPPSTCNFAPVYLDSIDSVYRSNGTLQFDPTIGNYQTYCNLIDTFNVHHGLTPLDSNYVTKLSYYQFFTQIVSNTPSAYYAFLNSFTDNIDSYYLAQNPGVFFSTYSNFNSVQLQYIRYQHAVDFYNDARDGVILDHIATVSLLDFVTTIYSENCDDYINYLLGHIANSSPTQTVLEYPYDWIALYYPSDCLSSYLDYAEAYSDHLTAYPSCLPQSYGTGQLLNYSQFQNQGLCSECGLDTIAYFITQMTTTASCNMALPYISTCRTPEEEFTYCSGRYNNYYLTAITDFNSSPWAIANNVTFNVEYATDTAFIAAGLCECAKPWQGYLFTYIYAQATDILPMPHSITEECIPTYDPPCADAYQEYLGCIALYNETAMDNESEDLITYIVPKQTFYSENLCNCVDDYCAELNLVSSGLKDFEDMPNLLTFCGCGFPPPCPNDSMNLNAEPFVVEFTDPCEEFYEANTTNAAYIAYEAQTQELMTDISSRYIQHCLTALENLSMTFNEVEHHFTLYYYDQAGNLIKTIPPEGVELVDVSDSVIKHAIVQDRANNTHQVITNHRMATTYLYNSLNQLVAQNMPDQDPMQIFEVTLPNGLPKQLNTTAIQMVNSNLGYLSGYIDNSSFPMGSRGYLFTTANGGQNWTRVSNTIASDLKSIRMLNSNDGFAIGSSGVLILTTDGGQSWDLVNTYSSNIQEDFVSLELSTTDAYALTRSGKVFKCTTAGVVTSFAAAPSNTSYTVNAFKDFSLQNNYASTTGILYIASLNDGTNNFDAVLLNAGSNLYTLEKVLAADLNAVSFYSASEGMVAGTDGNLSLLSGTSSSNFLQTMKVSGTVAPIDQIHMLNSQIGLARIEENGDKVIRKTTDGGATWLPLNQNYTNANLAFIKRSGTSNLEVLIQGYVNASSYSKTILLASNGMISELNQTPVAAQNIELKQVYVYQNGTSTTVFGIGANDSLYRSNTYSVPGSTLNFTSVAGAGTVPNAKQLLVAKYSSGVSVQVLLTTGTIKQSTCTTLNGTYTSFSSAAGATSLVWLDKITISSADYVLGYNTADSKVYWKTASSASMSAFTMTLSTGTSAISKIAVHGSQLTLIGTNGGLFTSGTISSVPSSISFDKREDHRLPALNSIRKLASNILITGDNGLLISRSISTSASTGTVKPLNTLSNLYTANEFTASSVNYYLLAGQGGYFNQFHAATFVKTDLLTTSGLTVSAHVQGASFRDIAVNGEAVYIVGDNGSAYFTPSVVSDFFLPAAHITNKRLMSVAFYGTNKAVAVGDGAELIRYMEHLGTLNNRIFSPKYRDVHFENPQFGTVVGDHFFVRTTNNGGASWNISLPQSSLTLSSSNMHCLRKVWTRSGANATHFALLGGVDYLSTLSSGVFTPTTITGRVTDIQFSHNSPAAGYLTCDKGLCPITFTPSGNSYTLGTAPYIIFVWDTINAMHVFENQSVIFTGGSGFICYYTKSTNSFSTLLNITGTTLRDIYFHDNVSGYVVGNNGRFYYLNSVSNHNVTHDILSGGLTYSQQVINDPEIGSATNYNITAIAFNSRTTGVYGGNYTNPTYVTTKKAMVRNLKHEGGLYTARFYYDRLGRIVTSQNSRQFQQGKFSYTLYDELGRVYEAGEKTENDSPDPQFASIFGTDVGGMVIPTVIDDTKLATWLDNDATATRKEVTRSYYDVTNTAIEANLPLALNEATQRKRIVHVTYEAVYDGLDDIYDHATHYDYDIHGNVKTLLQENQLLGAIVNLDQHRFKRMDYTYDLISGNVHRVDYETGNADQWHHAYNYDADNRITDVYTTKETPLMDINSSVASLQNEPEINVLWDQEARYEYYAHGPLARTTIGDNEVQGVDYVYTLQGWIKGVNSNGLNQDKDPGRDGNGVSDHKQVARDVFGYSLHYFTGDYSPIVGGNTGFIASQGSSDLTANSSDLYNGNIGRMITTITDPNTRTVLPLGNAYKYDQLNRLKQSKSFNNFDAASNSWGSGGTTMYYNAFTYDANGNIETQVRKNHAGTTIDDLTYAYHDLNGKRLRNRLYGVDDGISGGTFSDDIDDMSIDTAQATIASNNNYVYDAEGRLVKDLQEEIDTIIWRVDGKVKSILRPGSSAKRNVSFDYDAMGHRIAKHTITQAGDLASSTYYVLDAQGNVMSVYEKNFMLAGSRSGTVTFAQAEKHIYGSSRLGINDQALPMLGSQNNSYIMGTVNHRVGHRLYELSNHLGNVLSVVSDKLKPTQEEYETVVDFDDRFDTDGDFVGWNVYTCCGDTAFVDNGTLTSKSWMDILKYVPFITTSIPYYGGNWNTNYTLTFDLQYLPPGGTFRLTDDGSQFQDFYSTGSHTWNLISLPWMGAGIIYNSMGDSVVLDNIKLVHDVPPYLYHVADIRQSTDYSPFGVTLENRNLTLTGAEKSRYGFQNQERDDEIKGEGNSINFEYRMHDPRLGRFFKIDPLAPRYPYNSPYAFSENRVIDGIELEGLEYVKVNAVVNQSTGETFEQLFGDLIENYPNKILTTDKGVFYNVGYHLYSTTDPNGPVSFMNKPGSTRITEWLYTDIQNVDINTDKIYGWNEESVKGEQNFSTGTVQNNQNCYVLSDYQASSLGSHPTGGGIQIMNSSTGEYQYANSNTLQLGIDYINRELEAGRVVQVGVDYDATKNKNPDGTDHFIVITGRGIDINGKPYFKFVDNRFLYNQEEKNAGMVDSKGTPLSTTGNRIGMRKHSLAGSGSINSKGIYTITLIIKNKESVNQRPLDQGD
jgi:RHS repeat-associated protein